VRLRAGAPRGLEPRGQHFPDAGLVVYHKNVCIHR